MLVLAFFLPADKDTEEAILQQEKRMNQIWNSHFDAVGSSAAGLACISAVLGHGFSPQPGMVS